MAAPTYIIYNGPLATTAAPTAQPTGTAIRTMLQIKPAKKIRVVEWGCSFAGVSVTTPGTVELIETGTVFGTLGNALSITDLQLYGDSGGFVSAAGDPLAFGTTATSYATAANTEGAITTTRMADLQLVSPTNQYWKQFPLGREFEVAANACLRVRCTFANTVNMLCYVIFEV